MGNKVTKVRIEDLLNGCTYHFSKLNGTTTVCQVVLKNGFSVSIGMSACIDPANFNAELGEQYAKEDAVRKATDKLWELEGYLLAMKLNPV